MSKLYSRKFVDGSKDDKSALLCWRNWDGEAVVYDSTSGSTHLLEPLAAEALKSIYQCPVPLSLDQIALEIPAEDEALQQEIRDRIDEIVLVFEELGLIEATT